MRDLHTQIGSGWLTGDGRDRDRCYDPGALATVGGDVEGPAHKASTLLHAEDAQLSLRTEVGRTFRHRKPFPIVRNREIDGLLAETQGYVGMGCSAVPFDVAECFLRDPEQREFRCSRRPVARATGSASIASVR